MPSFSPVLCIKFVCKRIKYTGIYGCLYRQEFVWGPRTPEALTANERLVNPSSLISWSPTWETVQVRVRLEINLIINLQCGCQQ